MTKDKSLTIQVSNESLKKIKKLAIDAEISPSKQASELLEKLLSNKKVKEVDITE